MKSQLCSLVLIVLLPILGETHPVIFKGGTVLTSTHNENFNTFEAHYSFTSRFALGGNFGEIRLADKKYDYGLVQANFLAWRGNYEDSQANIYLQAGAGKLREGDSAQKYQLMLDWEDRDYYTVLKLGQFALSDERVDFYQARLGFSPYRGDFENWQAFFIFQFDYNKKMHKHVIATPVLRLFYQNILIEFGSSMEGKSWLQLMTHI